MRLYDENGNILHDFGSALSFSPGFHVMPNGDYRLYVYRMPTNWGYYNTEIYSLPGKKDNTPYALSQKITELEADALLFQSQVSALTDANTKSLDRIDVLIQQLTDCEKTAVIPIEKSDKHGIKLVNNIVSDKAEMSIILPNNEKITETKFTVYDMASNVILETTVKDEVQWNLTNKTGRIVANGSYLIIAEVKGENGKIYHYSAKLGVKR